MNVSKSEIINSEKLLNRFVALWGFNEAAFGGFLHLVKFPFRGMFIGGNAVILIFLISFFSRNKRLLLRSTILVILVKFIISPYTPLNAYFAVAFQGLTGFILYKFFNFQKIVVFLHSVLAQIQSSLQKFITLTIYFGLTFWESINIYIAYIAEKFGFQNLSDENINFSFIIVASYVSIHILAGIYVGILALKTPKIITKRNSERLLKTERNIELAEEPDLKKRKKKPWWRRKSGILLLTLFIVMAIIPFLDPNLEKDVSYNVLYMIGRAILITILWFAVVAPLVVKMVQKYLLKKKNKYSDEVNDILDLIPKMKIITKENWKRNQIKGFRGFRSFTSDLFFDLLFWNDDSNNLKD